MSEEYNERAKPKSSASHAAQLRDRNSLCPSNISQQMARWKINGR